MLIKGEGWPKASSQKDNRRARLLAQHELTRADTQTRTLTKRTVLIKTRALRKTGDALDYTRSPQASFQKDKRCARLEEKHELTGADTDNYTDTGDPAH